MAHTEEEAEKQALALLWFDYEDDLTDRNQLRPTTAEATIHHVPQVSSHGLFKWSVVIIKEWIDA